MKILSVCEFDPAGVLGGHRKALRAAGVDYRIATMDVHNTGRAPSHDWHLGAADFDPESLATFADSADVLQLHPGIAQPWSYATRTPHYRDGDEVNFGPIDWRSPRFSKPRRLSYIHGSKNYAVNAPLYAKHWRNKGHALWASTFDYVDWMECTYAAPIVDLTTVPPVSALRGDDDPLVIAHAPTDPENCHTKEFMALCQKLGVVVDFIYNTQHPETMLRKSACNAGFDHLRGTFSVNTIENCMLGLVPLVGVQRKYLDLIDSELGEPVAALFLTTNLEELEGRVRALDNNPSGTRHLQNAAFDWAHTRLSSYVLTPKLISKYQELLA